MQNHSAKTKEKEIGSRLLNYLLLFVGVQMGAIVFSAIRTLYYFLMGVQSNMGPQLFIIFAPILSIPFTIIAFIIHITLSKYFSFNRYTEWFCAGVSYALPLLGLISGWLLLLFVICNPFSYTELQRLGKKRKKTGSAPDMGHSDK